MYVYAMIKDIDSGICPLTSHLPDAGGASQQFGVPVAPGAPPGWCVHCHGGGEGAAGCSRLLPQSDYHG